VKLDLTETARAKIREFLASEHTDGKPVRFAAEKTHCMGGRGYAYRLSLSEGKQEGDIAVVVGDQVLLVDPTSARLLEEVRIDYVDGFEGTGFAVVNSKALSRCPCGHHDILA